MREYFDRLGSEVDTMWSAVGRRPERLSGIASDVLTEVPVPDCLDATAVLDSLVRDDGMPIQRLPSDPFGQPPTVMYFNEGLEVQVLTWLDGSTVIHDHGFDGAFRVAQGSSLHVEYSFLPSESFADGRLLIGELPMLSSEVLGIGDVRPIVSGAGFIHALFHLERPSLTIVVRNLSSETAVPQLEYRPPGMAFEDTRSEARLGMRLRGLQSLRRVDPDEADRAVRELVDTEDLWTGFRVIDFWFEQFGMDSGLRGALDVLGPRYGSLIPVLEAMLDEHGRRRRIIQRRSMLDQQPHRLLMALVANLLGGSAIQSAVEAIFPEEDPGEKVIGLIEEMASPAYRGASGLNLGPAELDTLRSLIRQHHMGEALHALGFEWNAPSLGDALRILEDRT